MSFSRESAVWAFHGHPSPRIRLVHLFLANRADDEHGVCWPSLGTIARECMCSERWARVLVKQLIDVGLVEIQQRSQGHRSHRYRVLIPQPGSSYFPEPQTSGYRTCDTSEDADLRDFSDAQPGTPVQEPGTPVQEPGSDPPAEQQQREQNNHLEQSSEQPSSSREFRKSDNDDTTTATNGTKRRTPEQLKALEALTPRFEVEKANAS